MEDRLDVQRQPAETMVQERETYSEHVLHLNILSGTGDKRALLIQLLGEEINTEIAVLSSLGGGGDANDLARAALEDHNIANADEVGRNGDGVRH